MHRPHPRVLDLVGAAVRVGLAAVWLVSGSLKLADPGQTYLAVQAYELLPANTVNIVATGLPLLEIGLGLLLLVGLHTRLAAIASAVVLAAFMFGIAQAWARGLTIDCGCFSSGGQVAADDTAYPRQLAIDVGLFAATIWLAIRPQTWLSLDRWRRGGSMHHNDIPEQDPARV